MEGRDTFFVKNSPCIFPWGKSLLNLRFFAIFVKNLNCSYLLIEASYTTFKGFFELLMCFEFLRLKSFFFDYIF